jgi:hypothetical protein
MKGRAALVLASLLLSGCAMQGGAPMLPGSGSGSGSTSASTKSPAHPRFAPPPGGHSHWDSALGVYVLENAAQVYYRERTYYRWNNGWSWSSGAQGPWQPTDSSGVPAGLGRHYSR